MTFPDAAQVEEYGRFISSISPGDKTLSVADVTQIDPAQAEALQEIQSKDPLSELSEQEKDLLWQMRGVCCKKVPEALPKLLDAVKWNDRDHVSQVCIRLLVLRQSGRSSTVISKLYSCSCCCCCGLRFRQKLLWNCSTASTPTPLFANWPLGNGVNNSTWILDLG